jgi:hypothetical protein
MDYFSLGVFEAQTNRAPHSMKASLINSIKEEAARNEKVMVKAACGRFRGHVEFAIAFGSIYIK